MVARKIFLAAAVVPAFFFASVLVANAYSIEPGAGTANPAPTTAGSTEFNFGNGIQSLSAPFQSFMDSMQSIDAQNTNMGVDTNIPPIVTSTAQNWFQEFDNWLYGIAGFHISTILNAILNVFAWVLGLAKQIVDWLLSVIH